jgi:hypothetical protein
MDRGIGVVKPGVRAPKQRHQVNCLSFVQPVVGNGLCDILVVRRLRWRPLEGVVARGQPPLHVLVLRPITNPNKHVQMRQEASMASLKTLACATSSLLCYRGSKAR